MDPFIFNSVNKLIEKGAADGPIKTFNKTWELVLGKFHLYVDKVQYKRELDFEKFKAQFENEIGTVPEENLQEPKISLLGPALEASKYYIEEESLSRMFSKLIASSMDDRKNSDTHHSFVEVIKQLSPNDAILLKHLSSISVHPAVQFKAIINKDYATLKLSECVIKDSPLDIKSTELSINNLSRLGLVKESFSSSLTKPGIYDEFYKPIYYSYFIDVLIAEKNTLGGQNIMQLFKNGQNIQNVQNITKLDYDSILKIIKPWSLDIDKGMIDFTAYGNSFINACVN